MKEQIAAMFVVTQADGAWPNGATVFKRNSQSDDRTPNGTCGTIIGSIDVRELQKTAAYGYFIKWPDFPAPMFCMDTNNDGTVRLELAVQ